MSAAIVAAGAFATGLAQIADAWSPGVASAAVAEQVAQAPTPTVSDAAMDVTANVAAGMRIGVATERVNSTRNPSDTRIMPPPDHELVAVIAIVDAGRSSWISFPSDTHQSLSQLGEAHGNSGFLPWNVSIRKGQDPSPKQAKDAQFVTRGLFQAKKLVACSLYHMIRVRKSQKCCVTVHCFHQVMFPELYPVS